MAEAAFTRHEERLITLSLDTDISYEGKLYEVKDKWHFRHQIKHLYAWICFLTGENGMQRFLWIYLTSDYQVRVEVWDPLSTAELYAYMGSPLGKPAFTRDRSEGVERYTSLNTNHIQALSLVYHTELLGKNPPKVCLYSTGASWPFCVCRSRQIDPNALVIH